MTWHPRPSGTAVASTEGVRETMTGSTLSTRSPRARGDTAALLAQLSSNTDLAGLVERVVRNDLPWVVVPAAALRAWEERDPDGWAKVSTWLTTNDVAVVRI
jgi:hypothetical protein